MPRGTKPKTNDAKILKGTQPCRVNRSAPQPRASVPACPDHLDAFAREAWERIVPKLDAIGVLTELDGEALSLYCETYSLARHAEAEIRSSGVTTTTDLGSLKSNPAVGIVTGARRLMAAILVEFGLTPSSRSRVKTDAKPQDALADFLARRKA